MRHRLQRPRLYRAREQRGRRFAQCAGHGIEPMHLRIYTQSGKTPVEGPWARLHEPVPARRRVLDCFRRWCGRLTTTWSANVSHNAAAGLCTDTVPTPLTSGWPERSLCAICCSSLQKRTVIGRDTTSQAREQNRSDVWLVPVKSVCDCACACGRGCARVPAVR